MASLASHQNRPCNQLVYSLVGTRMANWYGKTKPDRTRQNELSEIKSYISHFHLLVVSLHLLNFFSLSYGASHHLDVHDPHVADKRIHNGVVEGNISRGRIAAETLNTSTYIILAANRTHRRDPSDGLSFYTGGWNITNPHYLSSVAFSAIGPMVVAVLWFIMFGLCLLCLFIRRCCCRKKIYGYSRTAYVVSVVFLLIFTLAALVGIIFIYVDQAKFLDRIIDVLSSILEEAHGVVLKLTNLLYNLLAAKDAGFDDFPIPTGIQNSINKAEYTINIVADHLHNVTRDNSKEIRSYLNPLRVMIICVASAMLVLAILGSLLSILGMQRLVYCLIIIGWILITATFILSGIFLLVHNLVTDTCAAIDEWLQNPNANSALEEIIPKVDNRTTEEISSVTKSVTFGLISMVNEEIVNVSNANLGPISGPMFYNQTGPLIPVLCNPYHSNLTDRKCAAGEVNFSNASQVWTNYVCQVSSSGICNTTGRLTPERYKQITAAANISSILYTGMPFVLDLIDATYLKETFSEISKDHCPSLEICTRWMYIIFTSSSVAVMLSMILWVIYARERRHRAFSKKINRGVI